MGKILDSIKKSLNERMDDKTGLPYVKGKKAFKGEPDSVGVAREYEDDPGLSGYDRIKNNQKGHL